MYRLLFLHFLLHIKNCMLLKCRTKVRWMSVSCVWWTWPAVNAPAEPKLKEVASVKQVSFFLFSWDQWFSDTQTLVFGGVTDSVGVLPWHAIHLNVCTNTVWKAELSSVTPMTCTFRNIWLHLHRCVKKTSKDWIRTKLWYSRFNLCVQCWHSCNLLHLSFLSY